MEIENCGYNLAGFDHFKSETLTDLKRVKYRDLEDMVFRLQLIYHEVVDILDVKYIAGSSKGYTLPPGMYEIIDISFVLKALFFKEVKVNIAVDVVRLKSNLPTNKTIRFTKRSLFYVNLGFPHSHSGNLGDIPEFIQLIPGSNKSDKPINTSRIDKVQLKCNVVDGSIVNGI